MGTPFPRRTTLLLLVVIVAGACSRERSAEPPADAQPAENREARAEPIDVTRLGYFLVPAEANVPDRELMMERDSRRVVRSPLIVDAASIQVPRSGIVPLSDIVDVSMLRAASSGVEVHLVSNLPARTFVVPFGSSAAANAVVQALPDDLLEISRRIEGGKPLIGSVSARIIELLPPPVEFRIGPIRPSSGTVFRASVANASAWRNPFLCRVDALSDGVRKTLFEETFRFDEDPAWREISIPLSQFEHEEVELVLIADAPPEALPVADDSEGWFAPVWADLMFLEPGYAPKAEQNNVILISLDTVRADHLGCYGYDQNTTPNIDAFSGEAVLFEQCDASAPWTTPSHAAVMTGISPFDQTHSRDHFYDVRRPQTTLAELAAESGYLTAGFCEGVLLSANRGFAQGFQRYWEGLGYDPHVPGSSVETFDRARNWLDEFSEFPFFLFVHTYEAHHPYEPLEPYRAQFAQGMAEPEGYTADVHFEYSRRMYDAELAHVDAQLGEFFDFLRARGLLERTHVILMSDHGEEFGEHGGAQHMKTLYREVVHVPLIIRLAGAQPPRSRVNTDIELIDVFATAAEMLSLDGSSGAHSQSLMPLIRPGGQATYHRGVVVSSLRNLLRNYALISARHGNEKYIAAVPFDAPGSPLAGAVEALAGGRFVERELLSALEAQGPPARLEGVSPAATEKYPGPREMFFDLGLDPSEQDDRSDRQAARLVEMRNELNALLGAMPAINAVETPSADLSDQDRDELEAMGYLD